MSSSENEELSYVHAGIEDDRSREGSPENDEGEPVGYGHSDQEDDDDDDDEDDDEDEEEARKVADGFIVDDEEDDQAQESDDSDKVAVRRTKRTRIQEYDEELDEEDLELLEENTGIKLARPQGPKLKRLKRGRAESEQEKSTSRATTDFFSDEEDTAPAGEVDRRGYDDASRYERAPYHRRDTYDDMGDFIAEEDEDDLDEVMGDRYASHADRSAADYDEGDGRQRANKGMMNILPEGMSEDVLFEMYEIFGDGRDYEWALYEDETKEKKTELDEIFEPSELARHVMTDEDKTIIATDIPERLQMRYAGSGKVFEDGDLETAREEGSWIADKISEARGEVQTTDKLRDAVIWVVNFLNVEHRDIPYIKDYRRDFFTEIDQTTGSTINLLSENELWDIYDWDFKYNGFMNRKKALDKYLARRNIHDSYVDDLKGKIEKDVEVVDLMQYVDHKFVENIKQTNQTNQLKKGPKRSTTSSYELSKHTKVPSFLKRFSVTSQDLGSNYLEGNRRYYPEDPMTHPDAEAELYVDTTFKKAEDVLRAAKRILAEEIVNDPQVRKAVRRDWENMSVVNVKPTEKGQTVIDEHHPLGPFKFLRDKPTTTFKDGEYLQLLKGEEDGLIKLEMTILDHDIWFNGVAEFYISDGYSDSIEQWNYLRKEILSDALKKLGAQMAKYITDKLKGEAQECICKAACQSLHAKINVGPFRGLNADRYKNHMPRIVTISQGNGGVKDAVMAIFMNRSGKVIDQIQVPTLREERYQREVKDFIRARKPNVVGVAGYNVETRRLLKHMQEMVSELNHSRESESTPTVDLVVVNDEAARLYKNSKRAKEEFGEYPETMRYCVALARRLQNPVMEYVGLGKDLLAIRHHELQHLVHEKQMFPYLERALVMVVNDFGVDINLAAQSGYHANAVQYVSGLGPTKADYFLKKISAKISAAGPLESRYALPLKCKMQPNTFVNCASYLRIRNVEDAYIVDDTRIHPEDYEMAFKMAANALEIDEVDEEEVDNFELKNRVLTSVIREYPEKLDDLILDDYADELRKQFNVPKRQTLEGIKQELQGPYHDRRQKYTRPSLEETFMMITGETLQRGLSVPAKITSIRGPMAHCVLDSGLQGIIRAENVSDDRVMSVGDVLTVGQTVQCNVVHIDHERFEVELSCKTSGPSQSSHLVRKDEYYDDNAEKRQRMEATSRHREKVSGRSVQHPLFRPFSHREAEQYLEKRESGDAVIRFSSKGKSHVSVTWKVDHGVYQHLDVVPTQDAGSEQLMLNNTMYDDWDHLLVSYIEATAENVKALQRHEKYSEGGREALDQFLQGKIRENPRISAYGFCLSEKPGYFYLGCRHPSRNMRDKMPMECWTVKPLPDGYELQLPKRYGLRPTEYADVNALINGFKKLQSKKHRAH